MQMANKIGRRQLVLIQHKRQQRPHVQLTLNKHTSIFKTTVLSMMMLTTLMTSGCANMDKQDVGTLSGAVIGGLVGSRFGGGEGRVAMAIVGTGVGAFIGSKIGASMDRQDTIALNAALEKNRTGQTKSWTNPDTHHRYKVTPTKTYKHHGQYCRNYKMTAIIDGKAEIIRGKACRDTNGVWKNR